MSVLNLTGNETTGKMWKSGIVDLPPRSLYRLREALTFDDSPSYRDIAKRVKTIVRLAKNRKAECVLLNAEPYLLVALDHAFTKEGILVTYAYEKKITVETQGPEDITQRITSAKYIHLVPSPYNIGA